MSTNYIKSLSKIEINSIISEIEKNNKKNRKDINEIISKLKCTSKNLNLLKFFIKINIYSTQDLITNINCTIRKSYTILGLKYKLELSPDKCKRIKTYIC